MIPGVGNKMQGLDIDDGMMDKTAAIIYSMTKDCLLYTSIDVLSLEGGYTGWLLSLMKEEQENDQKTEQNNKERCV